MFCDICNKATARTIHATKSYGQGDDLLVIENVPAVSCRTCGQSYLTAATLREIDNIKTNRAKRAKCRPVAVAVLYD